MNRQTLLSAGVAALAISAAAYAAKPIDAYVELDVGAARCGFTEIGDAIAMAQRIGQAPA